ncbi:transcriptional regulator, partial [Roseovarius spongiae]
SAKLDLCVSDPGGDTDLYLAATLKDFIRVYRGDVRLASAIEDGRLTVDGAPKLIRRLERWFNFGVVERTDPAESAPARRPVARTAQSR